MKHHIIVKYAEGIEDKGALVTDIKALYAGATKIPGIHGVALYENCVARPNRYDLMIVLDMDAEALANWDNSEIHKTWKNRFGDIVAQKAIFDCE